MKSIKAYTKTIIALSLLSISLLVVSSAYTFSSFSANVKSKFALKAASKADILKIEGIQYKDPAKYELTQAYLIIDKICSENMISTFEIPSQSSSPDDLMNLNRYLVTPSPIVLSNGRNLIPINVNVSEKNNTDLGSLLNSHKPNDVLLTGKINTYGFNRFVSESIQVQFSARHLQYSIMAELNKVK